MKKIRAHRLKYVARELIPLMTFKPARI